MSLKAIFHAGSRWNLRLRAGCVQVMCRLCAGAPDNPVPPRCTLRLSPHRDKMTPIGSGAKPGTAMTSDGQSERSVQRSQSAIVSFLRVMVMVLGTPLFLGVFLFLAAGDLTWLRGWLFVSVCVAANMLVVPYTWRVNPELLVARSRIRFAKGWDKIWAFFMIPSVAAIFLVAALDDGRFHWLPVPWGVCGLGYALYLVGMGLATSVGAVNKFAEAGVRIQTERGHKVIDTGPYAVVRHPGYVAAIPLFVGIALCLGSLWALVPAALSALLLILRTQWEDQTLQAELPGYKEYTTKVPHKLIPGLW
jgi:protein-S-isoprenylcysteine O-methyltransferase Ste14